MKLLRTICRYILGAVFLFSGYTKLVSPVGTSLIIKEYLAAFGLSFLSPISIVLAFILPVVEFVTGAGIFLRLRFRLSSTVAFYLIGFFTLLTLYLAIFNPIEDCGCFGQAVHLTNWQTFYKNLILLPIALFLYLMRNKVEPLSSTRIETVLFCLMSIIAVFMCVKSYFFTPIQEYTPYKIGADLTEREIINTYQTTFMYEKDGDVREFTLEDLPDDTWTFIEARTENLADSSAFSNSNAVALADLIFFDSDGVDITENILDREKILLVTTYKPSALSKKQLENIALLRTACENVGVDFALISTVDIPGYDVYTADSKLLVTFNRSNGGATYLNRGVIGNKWSVYNLPIDKMSKAVERDNEIVTIQNTIRKRLEGYFFLVGIILLLILSSLTSKMANRVKSVRIRRRNSRLGKPQQ